MVMAKDMASVASINRFNVDMHDWSMLWKHAMPMTVHPVERVLDAG